MRALRTALTATLAVGLFVQSATAQSLALRVFDRYLDALRSEYGIPGLAAVIVQDGTIVLERYLGSSDVAAQQAVLPDTAFPVGNLSEVFGSTLVLQQCIDYRAVDVNDRLSQWLSFNEPATTIAQLLGHVSPAGSYAYNSSRFALLTNLVTVCAGDPYPRVLASQIFDRAAMIHSVPGLDAVTSKAPLFSASQLNQYRAALAQLAVPYRLDSKKTAIRSDYSTPSVDAATGVISTARDLASFDNSLSVLLAPDTLEAAWSRGANRPTGLGWFVQSYNEERVVWHFGLLPDAYSALLVKVPARHLTLILLANSDSLTSSFTVSNGNITDSLFARIFLRLFVG